MKFILGKKENMTEYFSEDGKVFPVTVVALDTMTVTQVKTKEKDGYSSVQIGFSEKKAKNLSKALKGHLKGLGNFRHIKEFKGDEGVEYKVGDKILPTEMFKEGDKVRISAISKGKGFQGVVKRHGFKGGPRTHGQKHSEREPGSIGGGLRTHVPKGMRMAGRMGSDRITERNKKVVFVDSENNLMLIGGGIPGSRGTLIEIVSK